MRRKNEDAGAERHLHLLFCEKGGGKIDTRKRITIRLPQDVYRDILDNLGNAASSTFNSFMTNAARFYLGYIKARETEDYLSKTLLSIISARQERSDKATVSVLYALAVELNILQRILVSHFDIPDEVYAELRRKARAEVAVSRKGAQIESVQAQRVLVEKLLRDFPDARRSFEYEDYARRPTVRNASEFITRTLEEHLELFDARSNYVSYIAQRPRVQRSGAHGLFTQEEDAPDLNAAARAVSEHDGNIWTCILSLRREDAARLSYDKADAWRALLRANAAEIAARFNVPVGSFHWCGAFHNEAHHPHVHLVCYADRVQKPALTKEGVVQLRSLLARQIFRDELDAIYIRQSQSRDELRDLFSARLKEAVAGMRDAPAEMPVLESLLERLSEEVRDRKGKLRYGYLPWPVKSIVDSIISELEKQPQVKAAYSAWWELRKTVLSTYRDSLPEQAPPLHTQKEFRHLKNIVLRIAKEGCPAPEPEQEFDAVQDPQDRGAQHAVYGAKRLLDAAREEEYPDEDVQAALRTLLTAAERGDAYAQYQAGKLHREGYFLPRDDAGAKMFFERAAKQENHFAEYALGKLHADETSPFFDETKAADWFERAAEHGNGFAKYRLAKYFLNGKGRAVDAGSAARLFAEAAQASDVYVRRFVTPWAKYQLGKLYIRGNGVPRDWAKAEELLRSAAQDGNEFAQRLLQRRAQWHRLGPMDAALGVIGSLCRMFETSVPRIRPRCMYLDRKRRRELEQKQRALGHAENDFEPQM